MRTGRGLKTVLGLVVLFLMGNALECGAETIPKSILVPDVVGLVRAAAQNAVIAAGFTVGAVTEQYNQTVLPGVVFSQSPSANTLSTPNAAVNLFVSRGPQPVKVPNVAGQPKTSAEATIRNVNLIPGLVVEQYSNTVSIGNVISQNPEAGMDVLPRTVVNIVVSKGPVPVLVPNVTGHEESFAVNTLTSAGLVVGTVTRAYSDTVAEGEIITQSPAAGTRVPYGSNVNITVSRGPQPVSVTVPNVIAQTREQAESMITGLGLLVGSVKEAYSATIPAGQVVYQDPASGRSVNSGSAVDIVVSGGPAPKALPDVSGMTVEEVQSVLSGYVVALTEENSSTVTSGLIIRQDPAAGTSLAPGSTVNLIVSSGPASGCSGCQKGKASSVFDSLRMLLEGLFVAGTG